LSKSDMFHNAETKTEATIVTDPTQPIDIDGLLNTTPINNLSIAEKPPVKIVESEKEEIIEEIEEEEIEEGEDVLPPVSATISEIESKTETLDLNKVLGPVIEPPVASKIPDPVPVTPDKGGEVKVDQAPANGIDAMINQYMSQFK